jgi:hypothetical protein
VELVVQIRSPDDATCQKLPFCERMGVRELLLIELDRTLRQWRRHEGTLVEMAADADGWTQLISLPVQAPGDEVGGMTMEGPFGVTKFD